MFRIPITERTDWQQLAERLGFKFHTLYGEKYWDESAYYQFSLEQIERDIEAPTAEIHQMCLEVVDRVCRDESLLSRLQIPEPHWDLVRQSWLRHEPSLYSRLDFAYDGQSPAKLYENNADTPTSLYETGFWQWLWLETQVQRHRLPWRSDQFNALQEKLIERFKLLKGLKPDHTLYFSCCKHTEEDRGTVQYLEDCAQAAGILTKFVYIDDIGLNEQDEFTDLNDEPITWLFKLYPWEFMLREPFAQFITSSGLQCIEPAWKAIISNKGILPLLWQMFPHHPNLLPAYFEDQLSSASYPLIKKPLFSREGANIAILDGRQTKQLSDGPYGEEGYIYQAVHYLPKFAGNYTLIGSWLVDDQPAGISVREDSGLITQDLSRYLPHIILD